MRQAKNTELQSIFMMGFDTWADGADAESYLKSCFDSPKYAAGKWYVLENEGGLIASLVTYSLHPHPDIPSIGIGSIATQPEQRKRGHAAKLIEGVIAEVEAENQTRAIFLYSDISPRYYERFAFVALPPRLQSSQESTCMIRCHPEALQKLLKSPGFVVPGYF